MPELRCKSFYVAVSQQLEYCGSYLHVHEVIPQSTVKKTKDSIYWEDKSLSFQTESVFPMMDIYMLQKQVLKDQRCSFFPGFNKSVTCLDCTFLGTRAIHVVFNFAFPIVPNWATNTYKYLLNDWMLLNCNENVILILCPLSSCM